MLKSFNYVVGPIAQIHYYYACRLQLQLRTNNKNSTLMFCFTFKCLFGNPQPLPVEPNCERAGNKRGTGTKLQKKPLRISKSHSMKYSTIERPRIRSRFHKQSNNHPSSGFFLPFLWSLLLAQVPASKEIEMGNSVEDYNLILFLLWLRSSRHYILIYTGLFSHVHQAAARPTHLPLTITFFPLLSVNLLTLKCKAHSARSFTCNTQWCGSSCGWDLVVIMIRRP